VDIRKTKEFPNLLELLSTNETSIFTIVELHKQKKFLMPPAAKNFIDYKAGYNIKGLQRASKGPCYA
jgi:hypothetical protein